MHQNDLILVHAPSVYDFRKVSTLYGPVGKLTLSTPALEMYPVSFIMLADYLERDGFQVRIVNLAILMLRDRAFDAEQYLARLKPKAFGIDLHWLPHAHGALAVAALLKKLHPEIPVIFIGLSATYFHEELAARPEADIVARGDSVEEPMRLLMHHIAGGASGKPLEQIPNLTWKDSDGAIQVNSQDYCPTNLDHIRIDYSQLIRSVVRNMDMIGVLPCLGWLYSPIMAVISHRGRWNSGGSESASQNLCDRDTLAFRRPEDLAADIWSMSRWSRGPFFVLGDIRAGGKIYVDTFLSQVRGAGNPLIFELLTPAPREFFRQLGEAVPDFMLEMSPESHDAKIRGVLGRNYSNEELEETIAGALEAGCKRIDLFFRIGLPEQTYASVMETVEYCGELMKKFNIDGCRRLFPFIFPIAPFLDPGGEFFSKPEKYGYRLLRQTLEEHRQALTQPSWKQALNYETRWMNRDEIVKATYEAGLRFNQLKLNFGLISDKLAAAIQERIRRTMRLMAQIDEILAEPDEKMRNELLQAIKSQVDDVNASAVCDKRELEAQISGLWNINFLKGFQIAVSEMWRGLRRK